MFEKVILSKKPLIEIENIGDNNNMVSMYPNLSSGNEVDYVSEFVQDISEKKLAEEQIDSLKERVLRSQMNPHFIFNSLTSIQSYIITNETPMAWKYLNSFANNLQLGIDYYNDLFSQLKDRFEHTRHNVLNELDASAAMLKQLSYKIEELTLQPVEAK